MAGEAPSGADGSGARILAAVVFEAPHGTDGFVIRDDMGPVISFGRGGSCPIRFGHAPDADARLPRRAGDFVVVGDRLGVESSPEPAHPALLIRIEGRLPIELSQGELYSPSSTEYEVVVRGETEWVMAVRTRRRRPSEWAQPTDDGPPTHRLSLMLTDYEHAVLAAYVAPLRRGLLEPATHTEVAEVMHFSVSKVRGDLYAIWAKMISEGVPVLPYTDKRVAVTSAAITHNLL
jgi:hypothetical protein